MCEEFMVRSPWVAEVRGLASYETESPLERKKELLLSKCLCQCNYKMHISIGLEFGGISDGGF